MGSWRAALSRLYELEAGPGRLASMEGYRGLAIILVFFVHFDGLFQDYLAPGSAARAWLRVVGEVGNVGVDLFFVASGYLIYGAVIRRTVNYGSFIKRRVERIYPTFAVVFAMYLVLSLVFPAKSKIPSGLGPGLAFIVENFFLLPGMLDVTAIITPAWSLSYEFFYYLTIPLVVAALSMRRWAPRQRIAFFLLLTALFFAFCFLMSAARVRLSMFAAGILLYETMQSTDIPKKLTLRLETLGVSFVGLSFLALGLIYERYRVVSWLPGFEYASGTHRVLLMFFSFYVFALFCFAFDGVTNRILRWTPMRWLGNISYSFYLIHGLTLVAVSEVSHRIIPPSGHSPWLALGFLCVGFAATVASATLLFVLVEKPCSLTSKPKSL